MQFQFSERVIMSANHQQKKSHQTTKFCLGMIKVRTCVSSSAFELHHSLKYHPITTAITMMKKKRMISPIFAVIFCQNQVTRSEVNIDKFRSWNGKKV